MSVVALPVNTPAATDDGLLKQRVHQRLVAHGVDDASTDEASSPTANGAPPPIAIDAAASVAPLDGDTASDPADDESDSTEAVDRDVAEGPDAVFQKIYARPI